MKHKVLYVLIGALLATMTLFSCHSGQQNARQVSAAIEDTASSSEAYFRTITKIAYAKYLKG